MWNSRLRAWLPAAAVVVLLLLAVAGIWLVPRETRSLERSKLDLRDGILFAHGESRPFNGLLVESFPNGTRKLAIEIRAGLADGMSRGWFENGKPEVEERFSRGFSDGIRTRWHANGQRRSVAPIAHGKLSGRYEEWHPNGQKALEIVFVDGKPNGEARSWGEDGTARPPRFYRNGIAVAR